MSGVKKQVLSNAIDEFYKLKIRINQYKQGIIIIDVFLYFPYNQLDSRTKMMYIKMELDANNLYHCWLTSAINLRFAITKIVECFVRLYFLVMS